MARSRLTTALAVVVFAIVPLALVACGSDDDDSVAVEEWVSSVCSEVNEWRSSVLELADVEDGLDAESLRERVDGAEDETAELVNDLTELGAPDIESGDELQAALEDRVFALEREYDALREEAEDVLDASSPSGFLQALAELAPRFQSLLRETSGLLENLEQAPGVADAAREEVTAAFRDAEACRELRAAG